MSFLSCCGIAIGLIAIIMGSVHILLPRKRVSDACANEISSGIRTLPGLAFHCGWQELRPGSNANVWAFIQPNGSWCWSNAGLVSLIGRPEGLLIDTLTDPVLTTNMLNTIPEKEPLRTRIAAVVYTHPDIDHVAGDQAVPNGTPHFGREEVHIEILAQLKSLNGLLAMTSLGHYVWCLSEYIGWRRFATLLPDQLWSKAKFLLGWARMQWLMGRFNFHEMDAGQVVGVTDPILERRADIPVPGGLVANFLYMGKIHSKSDSVIMIPGSKVCFAGDLLFIGIAPVMWSGPASSWVDALDQLLLETDDSWLFVPGHGPVTDADGVRLVRSYFEYLSTSVADKCGVEAGAELDDGKCALKVLEGLPLDLRSAFREPQRILISAKIERMARRTGGPVKVDIVTKLKFLTEQGVYLVEGML